MLNTEKESHVAPLPSAAVHGSANGRDGYLNASKPGQARLVRPPVPKSWSDLPPGPRSPTPYQILGYWMRRNAWFERCRQRYGSPFTVSLRYPGVPMVIVSKPDHLKEMFLAPPDVLYAGDGSSELQKYFGPTGLAYLEEDEHLHKRKQVNKATHGEAMKQISESMDKVIQGQLDLWPRGELFELFPRVHRLAIEVIRYVNFGPAPDPRLDELVDVVTELMPHANNPASMIEDQYLHPNVRRLIAAMPFTGWKRAQQILDHADRLIYEVIEDRHKSGDTDGLDVVSVLLNSAHADGTPTRPVEIRDEIMTHFIAGTATTAGGAAWAVERLTREHDVRERLVAEIDAGQEDSYQDAMVYEILRRKPPLPQIIPRLVVKPFELAGYTCPPGTRLLGSAYLAHHDPENYPDPYAFRPERFLDQKPGAYTWIPFGGGRRRCLGKGIAELEIKKFIHALFQRFEVLPDMPEPEPTGSFMVVAKPARNACVKLAER